MLSRFLKVKQPQLSLVYLGFFSSFFVYVYIYAFHIRVERILLNNLFSQGSSIYCLRTNRRKLTPSFHTIRSDPSHHKYKYVRNKWTTPNESITAHCPVMLNCGVTAVNAADLLDAVLVLIGALLGAATTGCTLSTYQHRVINTLCTAVELESI